MHKAEIVSRSSNDVQQGERAAGSAAYRCPSCGPAAAKRRPLPAIATCWMAGRAAVLCAGRRTSGRGRWQLQAPAADCVHAKPGMQGALQREAQAHLPPLSTHFSLVAHAGLAQRDLQAHFPGAPLAAQTSLGAHAGLVQREAQAHLPGVPLAAHTSVGPQAGLVHCDLQAHFPGTPLAAHTSLDAHAGLVQREAQAHASPAPLRHSWLAAQAAAQRDWHRQPSAPSLTHSWLAPQAGAQRETHFGTPLPSPAWHSSFSAQAGVQGRSRQAHNPVDCQRRDGSRRQSSACISSLDW